MSADVQQPASSDESRTDVQQAAFGEDQDDDLSPSDVSPVSHVISKHRHTRRRRRRRRRSLVRPDE